MIREGLALDDVLLVVKYSDIASRSQVDLTVKMNDLVFSHPVIPSNMRTVTGKDMAWAVINSGGLAVLHRFMPLEEQLSIAEDLIDNFGNNNLAMSVGVKNLDKESVDQFVNIGIKIICIDIAHGDSKQGIEMTSWIKTKYPKVFVISGNVATGGGAVHLWESGADMCKSGIGSGSICSTRIETGNGVPQLTALMDAAEARDKLQSKQNRYIIADGGCKNSGDIVKSLCFADMVMTGNLFAGLDESPGNIINIDGRTYKEYVGSSTHKTNHVEGVAGFVPYRGSFTNNLIKLLEGVRSGLSYQGAHNLTELRDNPEFIKLSSAGIAESRTHSILLK
jgi:IMP dehydrogenase/GMP reductase